MEAAIANNAELFSIKGIHDCYKYFIRGCMSVKCLIGLHTWDKCTCPDCGKTRKHQWDKSNCVRCGADYTFKDKRDGKVYKCVKIGKQVWMAENLKYYPQGDLRNNCWIYFNMQSNFTKYGYLYSWDVAKRVCPPGWHLPSEIEWSELIEYLGGEKNAGKKLKSSNGWKNNGDGTNESGFTGLPGGMRDHDSNFLVLESMGYWWSSSELNPYVVAGLIYNSALCIYLHTNFDNVNGGYEIRKGKEVTRCGLSVRCIKNY